MNSYAEFGNENNIAAEKWIDDSLLAIGIMPHLNGFDMIIKSVKLTAENGCRGNIKDVYQKIADELGCRHQNIERNIRNAILYAHRNETLMQINTVAKKDILKNKYQTLSNNKLISLLAHFYPIQ